MEFKNESGLEFTDISSELWRRYTFPSGVKIEIGQPQQLSVSKSGGHRLFDSLGRCHYIPAGWVHLEWQAREGQPHFVK